MPTKNEDDFGQPPNPWQLYSSMDGWEVASKRIEDAFFAAMVTLDAAVASGTSVKVAAETAWKAVQHVMLDLKSYGSFDTEPRNHLADRIEAHLKSKYVDDVHVDSLGYVNIDDDF